MGKRAPETVSLEGHELAKEMIFPSGIDRLASQLDSESDPDIWIAGCRFEYIQDLRARSVTWWWRKVWSPQGCPITMMDLQAICSNDRWDERRIDFWKRTSLRAREKVQDFMAEEALGFARQLNGIRAGLLSYLTPIVERYEDEDGNPVEDIRFRVEPRSLEGACDAFLKVTKALIETTANAFDLLGLGGAVEAARDVSGPEDLMPTVIDENLRATADNLALGAITSKPRSDDE